MCEYQYDSVTDKIRQRVHAVGNHSGTAPEDACRYLTSCEEQIDNRSPQGDLSYLFLPFHYACSHLYFSTL